MRITYRYGRPLRTLAALTALGSGALLLTAARPGHPRATATGAAARATGATFKYRITSSSSDKRTRESRAMYADVRMQDGNIRMDYLEGMTPMGQKNGYVIVQGGTGKFIVVNPKDKQAMVMTAEGFGSGFGALMNNPMLKMTVSNTSFRFKDMGAGEPMLGYKTRRVRTWYSSTMELKATMMPDQKVVTTDSSDQWIATGVDLGSPKNMEQWARSFASGVKASNPELEAELRKYTSEYGSKGLALKTITWSTQTDKKGKVTADTMTMEVTELKAGDIDPAVFEIPKGYEVVDLSQMMAGLGTTMDSLKAAEAAKDEKKDDKPSGKDALKKGLGGLLKKKPPV
ncbi:MAG: hypothetical protein ACK6DR_04615 [Gemmatimonas sp.]|uniref:hypothetical protein n=1 Tax=Gemmatimonas sp. TaxID=1962908 RepID=UPI0022C9CBB8|nr:hypothetical protein [Gemmatimonas sp.]MCA2989395.1 DUF4412 domain-containing protein [Gemmatimonas sp.]MCE2954817.1 DUF4412 domain-containing protein [Gemmatimonas sp.]MCZ8265788.1 hypothetical protein [Gemmatimonas sp.]